MRWIVVVIGLVAGFGSGWLVHGPGGGEVAHVAAATSLGGAERGAAERQEAEMVVEEAPAAPRSHAADEALARWSADGRSLPAARALRAAEASELAELVEQIDALRRAGQSALLDGELETADARWGEALRLEASLGLERQSAASAELRRRLASAWHRRALIHEERGQLGPARAVWLRAVAIDPAHLDAIAGLQRLATRERGSDFPAIPGPWPTPTDRP